jgi:hypothetical protein
LLCIFLHPPVTSLDFVPNIPLSIIVKHLQPLVRP